MLWGLSRSTPFAKCWNASGPLDTRRAIDVCRRCVERRHRFGSVIQGKETLYRLFAPLDLPFRPSQQDLILSKLCCSTTSLPRGGLGWRHNIPSTPKARYCFFVFVRKKERRSISARIRHFLQLLQSLQP